MIVMAAGVGFAAHHLEHGDAAAQLGLAIGARIGERWRERAEQVAGTALILLGAYLIAERLAH
jgi:putative Mn2+ efflux pump MntP